MFEECGDNHFYFLYYDLSLAPTLRTIIKVQKTCVSLFLQIYFDRVSLDLNSVKLSLIRF